MIELPIDALKTLDLAQAHEAIERLEEDMAKHPDAVFDTPVFHRLTNGLYSRQILMPKGMVLTSEIHLTQHQFAILTGSAAVWTPETQKWVLYEAPFVGITEPGTRRVIAIIEECVWITLHPNPDNETNIQALEARLLDRKHRLRHYQLRAQKAHQLEDNK